MDDRGLRVGLLGCGHVGAGVAKMLLEDGGFLAQKLGGPIKLARVAVRSLGKSRAYAVPAALLTTNPADIVGNPEIDVVAELMGGLEPARGLVLAAIAAGQHVVTANKALIATHGREIFAAAARAGVEVMFEASVAGGIPVIRALKEGLAANRVSGLQGILNGTTNYILSRMTGEGLDFATALAAAQKAGYAEADPTFDVEGFDAAHKLIILTALAMGAMPGLDDLHVEGISRLTPQDFAFAKELGFVIKLLAVAARDGEGRLEARVHPAMLPAGGLLSTIGGAMNAILVEGHATGPILLTGQGAGMMPTASSVLSDLAELARNRRAGCGVRVPPLGWCALSDEKPKPMAEVATAYYLRFTVLDRPGVLAALAGLLAERGISLAQVIQKNAAPGSRAVPLVMLTHTALERDMQAALAEADKLDSVLEPTMLIRVEQKD